MMFTTDYSFHISPSTIESLLEISISLQSLFYICLRTVIFQEGSLTFEK